MTSILNHLKWFIYFKLIAKKHSFHHTCTSHFCTQASNFFDVYVKYCSNQTYQDRALKDLRWVGTWTIFSTTAWSLCLCFHVLSHALSLYYLSHCYFCRCYRKSVRFVDAVAKLQSCKKAQGLTLQSFLVLPMQRITRLPLLVNVSTNCCEMCLSLKICLQVTDLCSSVKPGLQRANHGRTFHQL